MELRNNVIVLSTLYILLFLACLNFIGRGSIFFILFTLIFLLVQKSYVLSELFIPSFVLGLTVLVGSSLYYGTDAMIKSINYIFAFMIGYNGYINAEDKKKYIYYTVAAIASGIGLNLIITYFYNYHESRDYIRTLRNFWTKDIQLATTYGLLSSVVISVAFYGIFIVSNKIVKLLTLGALIIVILLNNMTATRTPILLLGINFIVMFFLLNDGEHNEKSIKIRNRILGVFFVGIIIFLIDFLGIRSIVMQSDLFLRFQEKGIETSRVDLAHGFWGFALKYPLGGNHIHKAIGKSMHNIIQESYDMYGVVSAVAIICIYIQAARNAFYLWSHKKNDIDMLFISIYVTILIQMLAEPIMEAYPVMVCSFLVIHGFISAYISQNIEIDSKDILLEGNESL